MFKHSNKLGSATMHLGPGVQVRVVRLSAGWERSDHWVLGKVGVVDHYAGPNTDGTGWSLSVWLAEPETGEQSLWTFDEDELEPTGVLSNPNAPEVAAAEEAGPSEYDHIYVQLTPSIRPKDEADASLSGIREILRPMVSLVHGNVCRTREGNYEFDFSARTKNGFAAFKQLRTILPEGRAFTVNDDGWRIDCVWDRSAARGAPFLLPEVEYAEFGLLPWSDPKRRRRS